MKSQMKHLSNIVLATINIFFIIFALVKVYCISNIDFLELYFFYLIGIVIFLLFFKTSNTRNKIVIKIIFLLGMSFIIIFSKEFDFFIKDKVIKSINTIEVSMGLNKIVEYDDFRNIFKVVVPTITILVLALIEYNLELIDLLINFIFMMFLSYSGFEEKTVTIKYFFGLICIVLILFGQLKKTFFKDNKKLKVDIDLKAICFRGCIYSLIIFIIITKMPLNKKGMYYNKISGSMNCEETEGNKQYIIDEGYNVKKSGYQDTNKKLGGKLTISNEKVMDVYSDEKELYLRGNVKEFYTGHSWENLNKNLNLKDNLANNEAKYKDFKDVIEKEVIKIVPANSNIRAIFNPIYTSNIESDEKILTSIRYDTFFFYNDNVKPYTIEYYKERPIQNKIIDTLKDNSLRDNTSAYLNISNITKDTLDLTLNLITNCKTNEEKINNIVKYLEENCIYSLDVSEVENNEDFIDKFLFKEKKGYCVYFATALAMMSRIAGIPSRYVEGFKISDTPKKDGKYEVTNKDAHAWVEVLINSSQELWTTVDCSPTPRTLLVNENNNDSDKTTTNYNEHNEEIKNNDSKDIEKEDDKLNEHAEDNTLKRDITYNSIISNALIILFIAFLILIIRISISKIKIKKIARRNNPIEIYIYYINRIKVINLYKKENETDLEFAQSVKEKELKDKIMILVSESYKSIYGNYKIEIDGNIYCDFIDNYLKLRVNVIKYLLYKYILV